MALTPLTDSAKLFNRRRANLKAGMCMWCGKNPHEEGKRRCKPCIIADRLRKRPGAKWVKGKRGRPPEV